MGGFFHTGVGNGTARTTYAAIGQVQDGSVVYAAASGTDTYTATLAPAITAYATGMKLRIKIANANATTTPTLNVNSVGAKTIKYQGGSALAVGALAANGFYDLVYDGTDLILTNPATQPATTFGSTVTMTGAAINEAQGADIASATTTSIGAATGNSVTVTGTTTITGLGTVQAGTRRVVTFSGALTLTHNATSLILPGGVSITTVAGDKATFISLGSGNWFCLEYTRIDGRPVNQIKGTTIASATTTDIGAANGEYIDVSGTVTITALGTIAAGVQRIVTFTGALILTHNATSLILPGGANITTAAGDSAFFVSLGSGNWKCLAFVRASGLSVVRSKVAVIEDQKAANTAGGEFTSGSWQTHVLNTEVSDVDGIVTLATNQMSLTAGTYRATFTAFGCQVNGFRYRLRDVTNNATLGTSDSQFGPSGSSGPNAPATGVASFTLAGTAAVELQGWAASTKATDGYGQAANIDSLAEVYARVVVEKLA